MDPQTELTVCNSCPNIYKLELESSAFDEILHLFCIDILQGCSYSYVESVLVNYVTSVVEPIGWKAVWRSTKDRSVLGLEYDFIVEVVNVSLEKLEADIFVKSVIIDPSNECLLKYLQSKVKVDSLLTVPLIQLYTLSEGDDDEMYAKTATAIENVRFFMTHLSRPWDGEDDDVTYSEKILRPRLQLYFDVKDNILPNTMIIKIKSILNQGWRMLKELNTLYKDMNVSDSEAEINEDDLINSMAIKAKLNELQAKMEILENPVIRAFLMKKYVPTKFKKNPDQTDPIVYVVAKEFSYRMVSNLPIAETAKIEFEHNPETAFKYSSPGDKIFIFPGYYKCDSLGWLDSDITVQGIGCSSDIVLEATGNSEVLLNCCAQNVALQDITLRAKDGLLSVVVVHHGKVNIKDCVIDSNEADIGILLLGGAEAHVENSIVCNSNKDGIQMRCLSSLHLISSKVIHSVRHGIQLDVENGNTGTSLTEIEILKSHITNNGGHGIFLNNAPISTISLKRPPGDFSVFKFFPWLKYQIEDSEMKTNGRNDIGISSSSRNNKNARNSSSRVLPSCPNQEDVNCSVLSDLLDEISFSDFNVTKFDLESD